MIKNELKQKQLDEQKWLESEKQGWDLSGALDYCNYCKHRETFGTCPISQETRVLKCACTKAYNKMRRFEREMS